MHVDIDDKSFYCLNYNRKYCIFYPIIPFSLAGNVFDITVDYNNFETYMSVYICTYTNVVGMCFILNDQRQWLSVKVILAIITEKQ